MQAGRLVHGGSRYRWYLALTIGLILVNVAVWTRIVRESVAQNVLSVTSLIIAALASTLALGTVISLWRSPLSTNHRLLNTPALRYALATHQAGHIVAAFRADPDRMRRINLTEPCNHHRRVPPLVTETDLRTEIGVALAGMIADEVFSGESGSHAAADLERATVIAADMVGRFGMSGSPLSLQPGSRSRRSMISLVIGDPRTRKDLETLLRQAKQDTVQIMLENRHLIIALRDALARNERMSASQIRATIAEANLHRGQDDEVLVDLRVVSARPTAEASR